MAYGIAQKENRDVMEVKTKMVNKINMLREEEAVHLVSQMAILIDKSVQQGETIDDTNVDKDFISFLLRLYY